MLSEGSGDHFFKVNVILEKREELRFVGFINFLAIRKNQVYEVSKNKLIIALFAFIIADVEWRVL